MSSRDKKKGWQKKFHSSFCNRKSKGEQSRPVRRTPYCRQKLRLLSALYSNSAVPYPHTGKTVARAPALWRPSNLHSQQKEGYMRWEGKKYVSSRPVPFLRSVLHSHIKWLLPVSHWQPLLEGVRWEEIWRYGPSRDTCLLTMGNM